MVKTHRKQKSEADEGIASALDCPSGKNGFRVYALQRKVTTRKRLREEKRNEKKY